MTAVKPPSMSDGHLTTDDGTSDHRKCPARPPPRWPPNHCRDPTEPLPMATRPPPPLLFCQGYCGKNI